MDLHYTPSIHILQKHAISLCKQHNRSGELLVDLIEQCYQWMHRLHMRLADRWAELLQRRAEIMFKVMETADDSQLQAHIEAVMQSTKRKFREQPASHAKVEQEKEDCKATRSDERWMA